MSDDITQRIRDYARDYTSTTYHDALINEAANEIESLRQQLADSQKREAMLRDALNAMLDRFGIMSDGCIKQACNALSATADLDGLILCKKEQCRNDGRCQYAIDHGAEGLGHCPEGKCCMPLYRTWDPK